MVKRNINQLGLEAFARMALDAGIKITPGNAAAKAALGAMNREAKETGGECGDNRNAGGDEIYRQQPPDQRE